MLNLCDQAMISSKWCMKQEMLAQYMELNIEIFMFLCMDSCLSFFGSPHITSIESPDSDSIHIKLHNVYFIQKHMTQ